MYGDECHSSDPIIYISVPIGQPCGLSWQSFKRCTIYTSIYKSFIHRMCNRIVPFDRLESSGPRLSSSCTMLIATTLKHSHSYM